MAHFSPLPLGQLYRSEGTGLEMARSAAETQTGSQSQGQGRNGNSRSMFSNLSNRISGIRNSEREAVRTHQQENSQGRREGLLRELNRLRDVAVGRMPFNTAIGNNTQAADVEAQLVTPPNETSTRRGTSSTAKTRREKEEGAALFGPNLANYFGSGSSSSGAVAASVGADFTLNAASASAAQRKSRLGSRGRARGASLSGLLPDDFAMSASSLPDEGSADGKVAAQTEAMPMAEGIELDTIKRWIDRSVAGGALEIPGVEGVTGVAVDGGNPLALCSTLQSYVNLKRNTVKLNLVSEQDSDDVLSPTSHPRSATINSASSWGLTCPPPTHLLQFEYDCASPNAIIQVFARASRKHGSWATWAATRESAGLPTDLSSEGDEESRFYAQRGPPPHILGWPVFASRLKRGFGKPLRAGIALQLDLYAPAKIDMAGRRVEETGDNSREPETPGLDAGKMLGEDVPVTPAVTAVPVQDPLASYNVPVPASESKEEKAAREKAERETLKLTVVVEALDEDGKPLGEPNLQTTYLRLASLPMRLNQQNQSIVDASNVTEEGTGHIQDVAIPPVEEEGTEVLASATTTEETVKRIWSLQVEGQEAEIGPHRFQLQELYGLSSRPPPPNQEEHHGLEATEGAEGGEGETNTPAVDLSHMQDGNAGECLICLSSPPTTLLLPCTHGLCLECAVQLRESVKTVRQTERRRGRRPKRKYACPVCRRAYTNMLYLSTADEKKAAQAAASGT